MSKNYYKLNKEHILVEEVKSNRKNRIIKGLTMLLMPIIPVVGFHFVSKNSHGTMKERLLIQHKERLIERYDTLNSKITALNYNLAEIQEKDDYLYRPILEEPTIPSEVRNAGFGGHEVSIFPVRDPERDLVKLTAKEIERLNSKFRIQKKSYEALLDKALTKDVEIACRPGIQPVSVKDFGRVSDYFGYRSYHPVTGARGVMHKGIDLTGPMGSNVYSTGNGVVVRAGWAFGYGRLIAVDHGFGYQTRYGHLQKIEVAVGDTVSRGSVIGKLGNSGRSTGPHLHYEVRLNGRAVNPLYYYNNDLSEEEYERMIDYWVKNTE